MYMPNGPTYPNLLSLYFPLPQGCETPVADLPGCETPVADLPGCPGRVPRDRQSGCDLSRVLVFFFVAGSGRGLMC